MTQQFTQSFNVAVRLQAGRCKGMTKRMRMRLMDTGFFQIAVNALTVASRFDWLFLIARKKPNSAAEIFRQLLQNTKQRFGNGNLTMGVLGLGGLNDDFVWPFPQEIRVTVRWIVTVPADKSKSPHFNPQISPIRSLTETKQ